MCRRKCFCQKFSVVYVLNIVISLCSSVQSFRNIPNCLLNLINHLSWCHSLIHLLWNQSLLLPSPCSLSSRKLILNLEGTCFFSIQRETKINFKMLLDLFFIRQPEYNTSYKEISYLVQGPLCKSFALIFFFTILLYFLPLRGMGIYFTWINFDCSLLDCILSISQALLNPSQITLTHFTFIQVAIDKVKIILQCTKSLNSLLSD